ncbi:hypothetical protein C8R46DRAFT_1326189 [Mycena filopes]|nr:hypothetical protein C8R46DRAFT_1326189 [Mycena filopes]
MLLCCEPGLVLVLTPLFPPRRRWRAVSPRAWPGALAMLSFAFKLVWVIVTALGTLLSVVTLAVFGFLVGRPWAPLAYGFALATYQTIFCLGMIWRMDPLRMPREFCVAQAILMNLGIYMLGGLGMVLSVGTTLLAIKPKRWGDISRAFQWRAIYLLPVVGYPLIATTVYTTLVLKYDAIEAVPGLACDVAHPPWIRVLSQTLPAALLVLPAVWLSIISWRHVDHAAKHAERARRDDHEITRQMRRDRQNSGHPMASSFNRLSAPPPAALPPTTRTGGGGFRVGFFGQQQPRRAPSPDRDSVSVRSVRSTASSSFPTFAPPDDKPGAGARSAEDGCGESYATTSNEGHGVNMNVLEVAMVVAGHGGKSKTQGRDEGDEDGDVDGGGYRLGHGGHGEDGATPSHISHIAHVPHRAPQIQRLILLQLSFPLSLVCYALSTIVEVGTHQARPPAFGSQNVFQIVSALGPGLLLILLPPDSVLEAMTMTRGASERVVWLLMWLV